MLKVAGLLLGTTYRKKKEKISLSYSMIQTPIDEFAKNIECQVFKNFKFLKV